MKFISRKTMSLLAAAAMTLSLASCGATASAEVTETASAAVTETATATAAVTEARSSATPGASEGQSNGKLGKITAVEGSTVTVALGEMERGGRGQMPPQRGGNQQTPPERPDADQSGSNQQTPPDLPAADQSGGNQQTPPDLPAADQSGGNQQTPPDLPAADQSGSNQQTPPQRPDGQGGFRGGFTQSGETVTIDLSLITRDGAAVTADDLSEGDLLMLSVDDSGTVTAAQVMTFPGRGGCDRQQPGGAGGPDASRTPDAATDASGGDA